MLSIIKWIIFIFLFTAFFLTLINIIYKQYNQWCDKTVDNLSFVFNCYNSISYDNIDIESNSLLGDYYIMGSAKSYQLGGNTGSIPSYTAIKNVINKGCRCIELDIHSSSNNKPIIKGLIPSVCIEEPLEFLKCCDIINDNAFKHNYPFIVLLNIYTDNKICLDNLGNYIQQSFQNKLLNKKYGNNNVNPYTININDCLNKIIFIVDISNSNIKSDSLTNSIIFNKYINGFINNSSDLNNSNLEINIINMSENSSLLSSYQSSNKNNSTNTLNDLIYFNKQFISICKPKIIDSVTNEIIQKDDLFNFDTYQSRLFGCQISLLYFNKYDSHLHNYMNFFKNKPFILKPKCLRYNPQPLPKIVEQNKDLSFALRKLKSVKGANNLNFNRNNMY